MIFNIGGLQSMEMGGGEARKRPGAGSEGHLAQDELISNMARPKILHHIFIAVLNQGRLSGRFYCSVSRSTSQHLEYLVWSVPDAKDYPN
jgi:hypothetical protein